MDTPDFKAFAKAWVEGDRRLAALMEKNPDAADELVARLARAMERRRHMVQSQVDQGGHLVIHVDPERLHPQTGVDSAALDEIAQAIEELDDEGS